MNQETKERIEKIRKGEVPEGYKETKIGIIPDDWKYYKFNEIFKTIKRPIIKQAENKYKRITVKRRLGGIQLRDIKKGKDILVKAQHLVKEKDIVISNKQVYHGAIGIVPKELENSIVSIEYNILRSKEQFDTDFLYYYMHIYPFKRTIIQRTQGVHEEKFVFLFNEWYNTLGMYIPKIKEQKKIVEIISIYDQGIKLKELLIREKQRFKKSLMQNIFTETIRFPEFTEDWEEVKLKTICNIHKGTQLNKLMLNSKGRYPALNGGIKPSGYTDKWNVNGQTITISEGGESCGYVNFMTCDFWCGGHCYYLTDLKINKILLYQILKYLESDIMKLRVGSGLPNIQKGGIENIKLNIPKNNKEQEMISNILFLHDSEIKELKDELNKLKEQKRGLMQLLLTGIVRVKVD
jgi:type I restriction enzyme, S subunit